MAGENQDLRQAPSGLSFGPVIGGRLSDFLIISSLESFLTLRWYLATARLCSCKVVEK